MTGQNSVEGKPTKRNHFFNFLSVVVTALLLILSFPRTDFWFFAWVAFIPLFNVLNGKRIMVSFRLCFYAGFFFFLGILYWLHHVTSLGGILLIFYLSLYFGIFGMGFYVFNRDKIFVKLIALPSLWVLLEFARARLLSGFDWGSLAYSQYKNLAIIQAADVFGYWGISFVIVLTNVCLFEFLRRDNLGPKRKIKYLVGVAIIILLMFGYGYYRLYSFEKHFEKNSSIVVGLVQGNISQDVKWVEAFHPQIIDRYKNFSLKLKTENPDLIIWPETSFPGYWQEDNDYKKHLEFFIGKQLQVPLLFGAVVEEEGKYFNSAILLSEEGQVHERYDKIRLVPFGEFLPFRKYLSFLSEVVPIADFTAGKFKTVFTSLSKGKLSTLICFEDSFSWLVRDFVRNGAQALVVLTNDAWFKDTKEAQMHLSESVLRAVESRRYFVRSANTGISGIIDAKGEVVATLLGEEHHLLFDQGALLQKVFLNDELSFYTRHGDFFIWICLMFVFICLFL